MSRLVLIVEEDPLVQAVVGTLADLEGLRVRAVCDGPAALRILGEEDSVELLVIGHPTVAADVLDDIIERTRRRGGATPIVLLHAGRAPPTVPAGVAVHVLHKPFSIEALQEVLRSVRGAPR